MVVAGGGVVSLECSVMPKDRGGRSRGADVTGRRGAAPLSESLGSRSATRVFRPLRPITRVSDPSIPVVNGGFRPE